MLIQWFVETLWVRNVDIQNPLWAFQTLTVLSLEAEITEIKQIINGMNKIAGHLAHNAVHYSKQLCH